MDSTKITYDKGHISCPLTQAELAMLGECLADILQKGEHLALSGAIGAGKTTLARALIRARLSGEALYEEIPSPTFTLVQVYRLRRVELWHFDLYRLTHSDEAYELGLFEALSQAICIIEWPERLGGMLPEGLHITLEHIEDPNVRLLRTKRSDKLLTALKRVLGG